MLYRIDEKNVHEFRKVIEKRREKIETFYDAVEVDKQESLLLFVDTARELDQPFDLEELRCTIIDQLEMCTKQNGLDVDALKAIESIINSISQCIYSKLFVPTKE